MGPNRQLLQHGLLQALYLLWSVDLLLLRERLMRWAGPYPHSGRFRLCRRNPDGTQTWLSFEDEVTARHFQKTHETPSIEELIAEFVQSRIDDGTLQVHSGKSLAAKVRPLLGVLVKLPPGDALRTYTNRCKEVSAATHRSELSAVKSFYLWAMAKGYSTTNPYALVEPKGRKNKGKLGLYNEQRQAFIDGCAAAGSDGDMALVTLAMGLRASETVYIRGVDIGADGGSLRVQGKTGVRTLEAPEMVREALRRLKGRTAPQDLVFTKSRFGLRRIVKRICRENGLPEITTQGLRGSNETEMRRIGSSPEQSAAYHGHTLKVAEVHYVNKTHLVEKPIELEIRHVKHNFGADIDERLLN